MHKRVTEGIVYDIVLDLDDIHDRLSTHQRVSAHVRASSDRVDGPHVQSESVQ